MELGKKKRSRAQVYEASPSYSVGDPAFADWLATIGLNWGGDINESNALGLTAFYRGCALISGTIASLPLKVYQDLGDGRRRQVDHYLTTNPAGPYDMSQFAWAETVVLHELLHGEAFLKGIENQAGEIIGQWPVHPLAVTGVRWDGADKVFRIAMSNGTSEDLMTGEITHIPSIATDGLRGLSPLSVFRRTLATARAGDTAANRSFTTGALISGMVTTEEDVNETEAAVIKEKLTPKITGVENAGSIAFVNRSLKFSPWTMSNVDAQFVEARGLSVQDVARIFGLPLNLLSVQGAVSNWGTGVAEANLGLQKYVLMPHTSRIESGLRAILPPDYFAEFDYKGLLQGTPREEIELLIAQVNAKLLTPDEARAVMNREPLPEQTEPAPLEVVA